MKLHWLLVKFRTEFKIILGTVRIFQCLAPSYIYQFLFLLINICDKILETQVIMFYLIMLVFNPSPHSVIEW